MATQTKQPLLSAYLIVGEDELKRNRALELLHRRLESMGDLDLNSDKFYGHEARGSEIVAACNTLPFTSEVRLVEVSDAEKLRKQDSEEIITYLESPATTSVLVLVTNKLPKGTRLYKAVEKQGKQAVIDCAPMNRKRLADALRDSAINHGFTITPGAVATLIDLVGTNTVALDSELQKIGLAHRGTDPVNEGEVLALVARTTETKPWEFVDAFASRNLARCVSLLPTMESTSPFALLGMCVSRIRELIAAKALARRGEAHGLAKELKLPDWRVKNHQAWARMYTSHDLVVALITARDAEQAMKTGSDPRKAFLDWLIQTMKKAA